LALIWVDDAIPVIIFSYVLTYVLGLISPGAKIAIAFNQASHGWLCSAFVVATLWQMRNNSQIVKTVAAMGNI
jgi:hypothetical protein